MTYVFRTFPGVAALFEEQGTSGDPFDINAARNAPAKTPNSWLHKNKLHSSYDNLEVAFDTTVAVNHAAVGGTSTGGVSGGADGGTGGGGTENSATIKYGQYALSTLLLTHNLGYVPDVAAVVDGATLYNGMPVQVGASDGRMRCCSIFVNTTQVWLYEHVTAGSATLSAVTKNYRVLVFRQPPAAVGNKLLDFDGVSTTKLAQERIKSNRRYLQVGSDSPFGLAYGKQADFATNGAPRFVNANGSVNDPVPPGLAGRFVISWWTGNVNRIWAPGYGGTLGYTGGFGGAGAIQVQPDRPNPVGAASRRGFFVESPNRVRLQDATREVASSDGNLFNFIRQTHSIGTQNVTFPDFTKDSTHCHTWNVRSNFGTYQIGEWCASMISVRPQTYTVQAVLMAVPTGADFFLGHFYLSRVTPPGSSWMGRTIAALPAQGQWFSMFGPTSVLCEAEVGMCRGFHIYISGGNLILETVQSVGNAAGGYGSDTQTSGGTPGGVEVVTSGAAGLPVAAVQSKSYGYTGSYPNVISARSDADQYEAGAPAQCSRSDPTSYYSNWQILGMSVRFGRRS